MRSSIASQYRQLVKDRSGSFHAGVWRFVYLKNGNSGSGVYAEFRHERSDRSYYCRVSEPNALRLISGVVEIRYRGRFAYIVTRHESVGW